MFRGKDSKETVVLRGWGVLKDNLVLATRLIKWIGHRKDICELTFRGLALRRSESRNCGLCVVYIQKEELRYWLVPGNVKNNRIN